MPEEHFNSNGFFRLMDMYDKYKAFESFGIEQVITIPFDKKFSELTKDLFIENILVKKLMTKHLVVGYDFKFGNKRLGDVSLLKLHRDKGIFDLSILDLVTVSGEKVSSRDIRKLINLGNIRVANKLISCPYSLSGIVILGEKSYGKGSVQSIIPLKNKGAIRLTVAKYYLPSGKSISEVGVKPDIEVNEEGDDFRIKTDTDNQLNYAIKLLNG